MRVRVSDGTLNSPIGPFQKMVLQVWSGVVPPHLVVTAVPSAGGGLCLSALFTRDCRHHQHSSTQTPNHTAQADPHLHASSARVNWVDVAGPTSTPNWPALRVWCGVGCARECVCVCVCARLRVCVCVCVCACACVCVWWPARIAQSCRPHCPLRAEGGGMWCCTPASPAWTGPAWQAPHPRQTGV